MREMIRILMLLQSKIRYECATLPECCGKIRHHVREPFAECFEKLEARLQRNVGEPFGEILTESVEEALKGMSVLAEDMQTFLAFARNGGISDRDMQLGILRESEELLQQRVTLLSEENASRCKLAMGLSVLGGLFLVVLFL